MNHLDMIKEMLGKHTHENSMEYTCLLDIYNRGSKAKDAVRLALYLESCAVDYGCKPDPERINQEDLDILCEWVEQGYIKVYYNPECTKRKLLTPKAPVGEKFYNLLRTRKLDARPWIIVPEPIIIEIAQTARRWRIKDSINFLQSKGYLNDE